MQGHSAAHGAPFGGAAPGRPQPRRKLIPSTQSQSKVVAKCTQRITALKTYATKGKISVHGTPTSEPQALAVYQACLDTRTTLTNLRGQVAVALAARIAADAAMKVLDAGVEAWVEATFGPTSQAAVDFGYAKKPVAKPTAEAKALAAQKAVATRNARGVSGKKKRAKVTAAAPVAAAAATPTASK
jgi:hypothetical protein